MAKVSKATELAGGLTLADLLTHRIERAFKAKSHLYAAWDISRMLSKEKGEGDAGKKRVDDAFQDTVCIIDDCLDNAIADAAQVAANKMQSIVSPKSAA